MKADILLVCAHSRYFFISFLEILSVG